jgi:MoaA/NifB/PqqE/SkfB family radical SAM enzyme
MAAADVCRVIREMKNAGVVALNLCGGGEPLLHPQFEEILAEALGLGLQVGVTTNGANLTFPLAKMIAEGCLWTRVSLDAGTPEQYAKTHGPDADFDKTIASLTMLASWPDRKAVVGASYLTGDTSYIDKAKAVKIAEATGADYILFKPYDGDAHDNSAMVDFLRAEVNGSSFSVIGYYERMQKLGRSYTRCHGMGFVTEITADGNLYPCCHWKERKQRAYGNVLNEPLAEIMARVPYSMTLEGCLSACKNHILNETVEQYFMQPVVHEAFL